MKNLSDEQLVSLCVQGDEGAFDELYNRYKDRLFSFIVQFVRHQRTAEDLLQETFVRVVRYAGRFNPRHKFRSWIYTIAANLCRDELKRRKRRAQTFSLDAEISTGEHDLLAVKDIIPSTDQGPRDKVSADEAGQIVNQAIATLPEKYRLVVELNLKQGFKYREVAKILKCPIGTVKSRIHKAMDLLRKELRQKGLQ